MLIKGPTCSRGYWNNDAATAEAIDATAGSTPATSASSTTTATCAITGRKKEIIVTAGGKNVAPAVLEDRLRAHPLVSQCMVVGDGKPFIAALVTLDPEALPAGWSARQGRGHGGRGPGRRPRPAAEIGEAVDDANQAVSRAEQIREFRILPVDFTEAGGELTPTMKVKRDVVVDEVRRRHRGLYAGRKQPA